MHAYRAPATTIYEGDARDSETRFSGALREGESETNEKGSEKERASASGSPALLALRRVHALKARTGPAGGRRTRVRDRGKEEYMAAAERLSVIRS